MNAYSEKSAETVQPASAQQNFNKSRRTLTHLAFLTVLITALYFLVGYENYERAIHATSQAIQTHCGHKFMKRKEFTDEIGFRVLIGIGVFAVLNVVVITVHHIVQKIARSTNSYKTIDHVVSPF